MAKHSTKPTLFLLISLGIGGSEKKTILLANTLFRRGCAIHLAYLNSPDTLQPDLDPNIPLVCLGRRGKFDLKAIWRLKYYLIKENIHKIWCINLYPLLYGMISKILSRRTKLSCCVFINATFFHNAAERRKMILYVPLLRRVQSCVFGCQYQKEFWVRKYGLDRTKCGIIYNGVDEEWYSINNLSINGNSIRSSYGVSDNDIVIGTVAQFRPEKKLEDLIEACQRLILEGYPIKVVLVGDGQELPRLQAMVQARGLQDRVLFRGELKDVRPALAAMDIFVLTSISVETFSNAALEAMAMERPVILSNLSGAQEMISDGENGYLYTPGDVAELVAALLKLLTDPRKRKVMGQTARKIVQKKFTAEKMISEYEKLLDG